VGAHARPASPAQPGVLGVAAARIAAEAQTPVSQQTLQRAAIQGMLKALSDRWAAYYTPAQYQAFAQSLAGEFTGIGVWIRQEPQGTMLVGSVDPDTPAAMAGLRVGDQLISVDGTPVAGQSLAAVTGELHGAAGTVVLVEYRVGALVRTVSITRVELAASDVTVQHLADGVLLIKVATFSGGVGAQVRAALADDPAANTDGVILDLRDDPGGLVDQAVQVAGLFLDGGPVVSYVERSGSTTLDASPGGDTIAPLVVLVDGGTASAAEIVAAALQDRDRAVVVGTRTFGKGSVQEPTTLPDGSAIEFTVGHYLTPDGRSIDGVGIDPDIAMAAGSSPDEVQARALQVIAGLVATTPSPGQG
jgi:carboxyl-terminal processing protease